jgi:phosphate transport system substrate-binding protein
VNPIRRMSRTKQPAAVKVPVHLQLSGMQAPSDRVAVLNAFYRLGSYAWSCCHRIVTELLRRCPALFCPIAKDLSRTMNQTPPPVLPLESHWELLTSFERGCSAAGDIARLVGISPRSSRWHRAAGCVPLATLVGFGLLLLSACSGGDQKASAAEKASASKAHRKESSIAINGAGATFPYPLYSKWMSAYNQLRPNIKINYQSIGSGGGIRQIIAGTVDFGATDAPMTPDEVSKVPHKILHVPMALGSVAVTYHLDGLTTPLNLSPGNLAGIFLGKIKRWNAPEIARENRAAKLPARDIAVVYRSDGSGTTAVFTDYLAKVSSEFKETVGQGKSVKWPVGLGAKGSEGVAGQVKTTPNAIGYVELIYATQNQMPSAQLKNASGKYVGPSIASTTAAAAGVELPGEMYASITDVAGEQAYPISSYTYLLVYEDLVDPTKGQALAEFLWWAVHDGQKECEQLGYSPLPVKVVAAVEGRLKELRVGEKKILAVR